MPHTKTHELKFPMTEIIEVFSSSPIPPTSPDFLTAMGRTNDANCLCRYNSAFVNTLMKMQKNFVKKCLAQLQMITENPLPIYLEIMSTIL